MVPLWFDLPFCSTDKNFHPRDRVGKKSQSPGISQIPGLFVFPDRDCPWGQSLFRSWISNVRPDFRIWRLEHPHHRVAESFPRLATRSWDFKFEIRCSSFWILGLCCGDHFMPWASSYGLWDGTLFSAPSVCSAPSPIKTTKFICRFQLFG